MRNKFKILHIVSGTNKDGAFKGVLVLHEALLNLGVKSTILNDCFDYNETTKNVSKIKDIYSIKKSTKLKIYSFIYVLIEKIIKSLFLKSKRSSFTIGLLGFDISNTEEYRNADIIHIHWINQGFVKLSSLHNFKKPIIWTMRDMWTFSGGSHYTMDFESYEKSRIAKMIKIYKKKFLTNIFFIAISEWLKKEAKKSFVLNEIKIQKIYNNIEYNKFKIISKKLAKSKLNITTDKKILIFGAVNPQHKRKGWDILVETLKKLDKSKYFLIIFGNFWSNKIINEIGIEYKIFGFVDELNKLNNIYSSGDLFIFSSIQEAFGKTWAEALACGTPVLCFNQTPAAEIIDHKKNGYIANNSDPNSLKEGIEWISKNIVKNDENVIEIRKKASEFDSRLIALQYKELYENILKKN